MFRRAGYILGLLFILACAAAYPLTWWKFYNVSHESRGRVEFATVQYGELTIGSVSLPTSVSNPHADQWEHGRGWTDSDGRRLYRARLRTTLPNPVVSFPLWIPAIAASLFMAWRWRRSRRRQAVGFPLDQRTDESAKNSN